MRQHVGTLRLGRLLGGLFLGFMVSACGRDPILDQVSEDLERAEDAPAAKPASGDPGPGAGPARAEPPGASPGPAPGAGRQAIGGEAGSSVTLSGTVVLDDWTTGSVRVDVFDGDQRAHSGPRPSVVSVTELDRPGPFEVRVDSSVGKVWVGGFVDENGDGRPGMGEPTGWSEANPVSTDGDRSGIVVQLERERPPGEQ